MTADLVRRWEPQPVGIGMVGVPVDDVEDSGLHGRVQECDEVVAPLGVLVAPPAPGEAHPRQDLDPPADRVVDCRLGRERQRLCPRSAHLLVVPGDGLGGGGEDPVEVSCGVDEDLVVDRILLVPEHRGDAERPALLEDLGEHVGILGVVLVERVVPGLVVAPPCRLDEEEIRSRPKLPLPPLLRQPGEIELGSETGLGELVEDAERSDRASRRRQLHLDRLVGILHLGAPGAVQGPQVLRELDQVTGSPGGVGQGGTDPEGPTGLDPLLHLAHPLELAATGLPPQCGLGPHAGHLRCLELFGRLGRK